MRHPTIMLVDDDPGLLTALTGMLQFRLPHVRVAPFDSPRTALACLETAKVDAIVTDLRMNEMDGLALLRSAYAVRPHVPVVMISGHAEQAIAAEAIGAGAFEFLQKPLDRDEFVDVVRHALKAHRLSRDVKARQLLSSRLRQHVARLDAVIQAGQDRPITIQEFQERIGVSRELTQSSNALLKRVLEEFQRRTIQVEATLRETEQRLLAARQEAHRRTAGRYSDRLSSLPH